MVFSFLFGGELYHDGKAESCRISGGGAEASGARLVKYTNRFLWFLGPQRIMNGFYG